MEDKHRDLDPWFYVSELDVTEFKVNLAFVSNSQRTVYLVTDNVTIAYKKFDQKRLGKPKGNGGRDKLAADLAQIMAISVPPTALWKSEAECGCIQKEPAHFKQTLKSFLKAVRVDPEGAKKLLPLVIDAYDGANVFFDVWLGNRDRGGNPNNVLIAESGTATLVWLIDYDCALSHAECPWDEGRCDDCGIEPKEPPVPSFILRNQEWVQRAIQSAEDFNERLASVDDETIDELCRRAFEFYGDEEKLELAATVADGLKRRRDKVTTWTKELLIA